MSWMIPKVEKGERPTFLEADYANQIVDAVNALGNITIQRGEGDMVLYSETGLKFVYKFPPTGWEEKTIEICEDGSAVSYTFLVRSAT